LLRVALLVVVLASLLAQILVPLLASQVATRFPEVAYLAIPYSVAAIPFIGCGQVALPAVWRLLSLVDDGLIVTRRAVRWVWVITACGALAAVLAAGVLLHVVGFVPGRGGPMLYYLVACVAGGLAFTLLMFVMRGLLETAIADH